VTRTRQAHVTYRCGGLLVETVINRQRWQTRLHHTPARTPGPTAHAQERYRSLKFELISAEVISMLGRRDRMVMWVIVVLLMTGASCEDISLTETVRTLQGQVSALLVDFTLLAKNSELNALREELTALRYVELAVENDMAGHSESRSGIDRWTSQNMVLTSVVGKIKRMLNE